MQLTCKGKLFWTPDARATTQQASLNTLAF